MSWSTRSDSARDTIPLYNCRCVVLATQFKRIQTYVDPRTRALFRAARNIRTLQLSGCKINMRINWNNKQCFQGRLLPQRTSYFTTNIYSRFRRVKHKENSYDPTIVWRTVVALWMLLHNRRASQHVRLVIRTVISV